MNRMLLDECFRVKVRENWHISIAEFECDLDEFITHHNIERSHQGYRLNGRTPAQALREPLGIENLPNLQFEVDIESIAETLPITEQQANFTSESA